MLEILDLLDLKHTEHPLGKLPGDSRHYCIALMHPNADSQAPSSGIHKGLPAPCAATIFPSKREAIQWRAATAFLSPGPSGALYRAR